ncbi:MAG: S9 family peptidase [Pseudomonadota bacterium]
MKTALLAATAALSIAIPMTTSAKNIESPRAITADDLVRLERVSDPRVSPDGKYVTYTLRQTDYAQNKGKKQIWLLDLKTKTTRALTSGKSGSSDARWAPDGKSVYFLSDSQVWRQAIGGKAQQVTRLPLDVNTFMLSPDGKRLALSMEVFPDCETLACTKQRLDQLAKQKNSGRLYDKLFARHWDTWKNGTRAQLFTLALDKKPAQPVHVSKGIDGDVPSKPFGDDGEWAFSPNSQLVVFAARIAGQTEAWSTNLDLWTAPSDGSEAPVNLTEENPATDTGPVFSPDGTHVAWRAMERAGFEADRYGIWLRNLETGEAREVAPSWDRSAEGLVFSADGKTLYTHADDVGQHRVFAVSVADGAVTTLTGEGSVSGFGLAGKKGDMVYAMNSLTSTDNLWLRTADGKTTQLTNHNEAALAKIQLGEFEQFSFAGANGDTVYGHVMKPWNYEDGEKYPVAMIIHGGPQGSMGNHWHYRWNPAVFSGMGYAVLFIDFHGSTGYGQAFTDAISGDWGGKPLEDLQKGWAHALKTYDYLDGARAAALGASYGGYMINWIAGNWPDAFKALVNHDGIFDNRSMAYTTEELWFDEWEHDGTQYDNPKSYEKHNPINHVSEWKTPMLVIHSEKDYRVTPEQGIATFTALQRRGIPSQLLVFPDENHWVLKPQNSVQWHSTVEAWLAKWIGD